MDRQDRETRRAENQVWNGWGDYARKPELLTFDRAGDAELYGNTVLGLACRYYDFDRFRPLLNEFHRSAQEALYTDIFFLVLEGAVFARGAAERPLLPALRRDYARRLLAQTPMAEGMNGDAVRRAWACRVLGQPEDPALSPLLDELAAPGDSTEAQLIQRTERVLYTWFRRARRAADDRQWAAWVGRKRDKSGGVHFVRPNALRALSHDAPGGSGGLQKQTLFSFLQGRTPEPILRRYVEDCFGASMLTPGQLSEAERTLCTGVHKNCRLHFTRGEPVGRAPAPEAAWDAAHFRQQREKNRAYYQEHLVENKLAIAQLTQKLQNTLLLRAEDEGGTGRAGRLRPELAWRAGALGDERVFSRRSPQEPGELSVDLLLDGSASQNRQQEKLATQAYLIAESLSRCRIPVRVTAFCSVSGCTVLRVLRDYDHPEQNEGAFDYVAAGWNRDGLALRAMGWLLRQRRSEQSLLLVLSDASPNDDQRIPNGLGGWAYTGKRGVDDTAAEAAALAAGRAAGVSVHRKRPGGAGRPAYLRTGHGAPAGHRVAGRRGDAADPGPAAAGIGRYSTHCDRKRRNVSAFDMGRREATGYVCVRRGTTGNDAKGHRATSKDENRREWPPYDVQGQNATQNDRKRHTEGCVSFAAQYQVMPSRSCICTRRSSSSVSAAAERTRPLGVTR